MKIQLKHIIPPQSTNFNSEIITVDFITITGHAHYGSLESLLNLLSHAYTHTHAREHIGVQLHTKRIQAHNCLFTTIKTWNFCTQLCTLKNTVAAKQPLPQFVLSKLSSPPQDRSIFKFHNRSSQ